MSYKYVTGDNLYEKQTYMYSEYKGMDFIKEYIDSRLMYINSWETLETFYNIEIEENTTKQDLQEILNELKKGYYKKEIIDKIKVYTKSFEVRKRLYTYYDTEMRPLEDSNFEDYENYILFAQCLLVIYKNTKCLKYYSCLLKVNDTLLSIQIKLNYLLKKELYQIIKEELDIFYQLLDERNIFLEAET